jgi:chemotaxis protein CheD
MTLPPCAPNALDVLRARKHRPHEAKFFFRDATFERASVKVLPGEYFVYDEDVALTTTLGSCVAACLHDSGSGIGGMNHFMLPDGATDAGGRFGVFAMELLINEMLKKGARRSGLKAKIFGGGQVMKSLAGTYIGQKNVAFVRQFLTEEGIPVLASDVLGVWPRKIVQFPRSGQVMCRRLAATHAGESVSQEENYRSQLVKEARGGEVELFT